MTKKEKFLVTGAAGYIGNEFVKELIGRGYRYRATDKNMSPQIMVQDQFDLTIHDRVSELISDYCPDIVLHFGSYSSGVYSEDYATALREDINALINILDCLQKFPATKFVYCSSSYVYSGLTTVEVCEDDARLEQSNGFGCSKLIFENIISRMCENFIIFRLANVYGSGRMFNETMISSWFADAASQGKIYVWGQGARKIQFTYMKDLVRCVLDYANISSGIYNLGGIGYVSVKDVAKFVADLFSVEIEYLADKDEGVTLPYMSSRKIISKLGDVTVFTQLSTGITEYFDSVVSEKYEKN